LPASQPEGDSPPEDPDGEAVTRGFHDPMHLLALAFLAVRLAGNARAAIFAVNRRGILRF